MNNESLIRDIATSRCISHHINTPFCFAGEIKACRIGFANAPVVQVKVHAKEIDGLAPLVRAHVFKTLAALDLPVDALEVTPTVALHNRRQVLFTDTNPDSKSCGKRKRGRISTWRFEIKDAKAVEAFAGLPRSWDGQQLMSTHWQMQHGGAS